MGTPLTPRRVRLAAALALTAALAACSGGTADEATSAAPGAATDPSSATEPAGADAGSTGAATTTGTNSGPTDTGAATQPAGVPAAPAPAAAAGSGAAAATAGSARAGVPADIAAGADRKNARGVSVPDAALANRDVIYTADLTVEVADVNKAVAQIESAVRAAGGIVAGSERSTESLAPVAAEPDAEPAPAPRSAATLTLRIPPGDFDSVLDRVGKLGLVLERNLTGKDVTEAVVDVKSRIASARTSVARIRDLMDRAVTLRDVVALEGELSQREADLDALLAKQATLKDQTSLATVTVHLQTAAVAAAAAEEDSDGFAAGLSDGWDAFSRAATAGATVLGALVPFAAATLLLGPPLWWLGNRISRTAPTLRRKVSPIEPG